MKNRIARYLVAAVLASAGPAFGLPCAGSVDELRLLAGDSSFPLEWAETTMSDGKPLMVSIAERDGALFLQFRKTREGLWAEGAARVCAVGGELQARIGRSRLQLGPAAHWIFRMSARDGARFTLTRLPSGMLRVATAGWSGVFSAVNERSALAADPDRAAAAPR